MSKTWTTQAGEVIPIKDMDDRHLVNSIRMLERNASGFYQSILNSYMGAEPGGEMAQEAKEREFSQLLDMEPMDAVKQLTEYNSLVWHAKRRGLLEQSNA